MMGPDSKELPCVSLLVQPLTPPASSSTTVPRPSDPSNSNAASPGDAPASPFQPSAAPPLQADLLTDLIDFEPLQSPVYSPAPPRTADTPYDNRTEQTSSYDAYGMTMYEHLLERLSRASPRLAALPRVAWSDLDWVCEALAKDMVPHQHGAADDGADGADGNGKRGVVAPEGLLATPGDRGSFRLSSSQHQAFSSSKQLPDMSSQPSPVAEGLPHPASDPRVAASCLGAAAAATAAAEAATAAASLAGADFRDLSPADREQGVQELVSNVDGVKGLLLELTDMFRAMRPQPSAGRHAAPPASPVPAAMEAVVPAVAPVAVPTLTVVTTAAPGSEAAAPWAPGSPAGRPPLSPFAAAAALAWDVGSGEWEVVEQEEEERQQSKQAAAAQGGAAPARPSPLGAKAPAAGRQAAAAATRGEKKKEAQRQPAKPAAVVATPPKHKKQPQQQQPRPATASPPSRTLAAPGGGGGCRTTTTIPAITSPLSPAALAALEYRYKRADKQVAIERKEKESVEKGAKPEGKGWTPLGAASPSSPPGQQGVKERRSPAPAPGPVAPGHTVAPVPAPRPARQPAYGDSAAFHRARKLFARQQQQAAAAAQSADAASWYLRLLSPGMATGAVSGMVKAAAGTGGGGFGGAARGVRSSGGAGFGGDSPRGGAGEALRRSAGEAPVAGLAAAPDVALLAQEGAVDAAVEGLRAFFAAEKVTLQLTKAGPCAYTLYGGRLLRLRLLPGGRLGVRLGGGYEELADSLARMPMPPQAQ